jgi:hypothetical protein
MRRSSADVIGVVTMTLVLVGIVALPPARGVAHAQRQAAGRAAQTSRTPWGHPNLQGTWTNTTVTPLQRPDDVKDRAVLTKEEAAAREAAATGSPDQPPAAGSTGTYNAFWWEKGSTVAGFRTSLITDPPDGRIPALTPEGERRARERGIALKARGPADSWTDRNGLERCLSRGMPGAMTPGFYNHNYQIFQTPDHVVILVEMIHDARIIPISGQARLSSSVRQWLGSSTGHWEGDTLVVETTNFNGGIADSPATCRRFFCGDGDRGLAASGVGEQARIVERFTPVDANTIDYRYTVSDPTTWVQPWTAAIPMRRLEERIFEYACHEGNYGLTNILRGHRADEAAITGAGVRPGGRN